MTNVARGVGESLEAHVGRRVRGLREERGWSQQDLGRRLAPYGFELTQSTVAKLENGARPVRLNEAAALAALFGVNISELIDAEVQAEASSDVEDRLRHLRWLHAAISDAQTALLAAKGAERRAAAAARAAEEHLDGLRAQLGEIAQPVRSDPPEIVDLLAALQRSVDAAKTVHQRREDAHGKY
jgi:transcriptional regulator with XRE-family HTH domain